LPIDLISNSGQWELSLEVSARSHLKMVVISIVIMTCDDLSIDRINLSIPGTLSLPNEVTFIEINLIRASKGVSISLECVIELIHSNGIISVKVLYCLVRALIKVVEIIVEI
jgi:hypothetical protein